MPCKTMLLSVFQIYTGHDVFCYTYSSDDSVYQKYWYIVFDIDISYHIVRKIIDFFFMSQYFKYRIISQYFKNIAVYRVQKYCAICDIFHIFAIFATDFSLQRITEKKITSSLLS